MSVPRHAAPLVLTAALALACSCGDPGPGEGHQDPAPDNRYAVEVATASADTVVRHLSAPGSLEPFESQLVCSRVAGVIRSIDVAEGDRIHAGQAIAHIEDERYRLAVRSAEASLARARANRTDADAAVSRRLDLAKSDPEQVNQEELAQYQAKAAQAAADVAQAQSDIDRARLDLSQTVITAASGGVIQARLAQTGSYAQPGASIASLVRRDPLRVRFTASAEDAALLRIGQLASFALLEGRTGRPAHITFIAAQADAASRLVTVMAEVDHDEPALVPGAFVEVSTEIGSPSPEVVVPETAVRPSDRGFLVYVLEHSQGRTLVRERLVAVDQRTGTGSISLRSGLSAGAELVVRGAGALRDGVEVRVVPAAPAAPAQAAR